MIIHERLNEAFHQLGLTQIPEILHNHSEAASKEDISYLKPLHKKK
ncbi:hypothetical protein Flexsi_1916 [Flexistipes sinusarabici DSM 4947]|uniref:Uncharacterized protein n=1 Tax=Flexistipes sinusarabici (strain ATCC 49648 / DSM 4947 / MAS 10) TaxID=717231 RepID=F8E4C3_FLESM|nr:hypothetical protein [Flexistipes sinusarabici]AEI15550.1 hypothetical protein Flexsi_1916 [Flexistipes sinusarabici DSM 4947]